METELLGILTQLHGIWTEIQTQAELLLLPSRLTQVAILAACLGVSWGLRRGLGPKMRDWMHGLDGRPLWQLRTLLVLYRRLWLIFFVILAWTATWTMQALYRFPSRSYLLELMATLATALLLVAFATRLVRNPALRSVVRWGLWAYVTLHYLGLKDEATSALDALALEIGEIRVSALLLLRAVVVTGALLVGARLLTRVTSERVRRATAVSPSMQVLVVKGFQILIYGIALVLGMRSLGIDLTGLAVLSGAIGVGLGFGLQKVVSNLVSGLILLLDKSIKPGDVISLGDTFGWIDALGARYVSVVTRDGKEYLIPNEDLITGQVVNWSHTNDFVRLDIFFGTAYGDDPHLVRRIAVAAAKSVDRVLQDRPPVCHIVGFGDSSVDYILRFWITDPTGGLTNIRGNVYLALWDAFKENGVSIPFPQREVTVLEGSMLAMQPAGDG